MKQNRISLPGTGFWTGIFAYFIAKPILWMIFLFHRLRYLPHLQKIPKGPLFLMGNHHSNWDGLYAVTYYFGHIPHFIVHDGFFSTSFRSFLSTHLLGQINRGSVDQRFGSVHQFLQYAQGGHTVGLFPEGDINMVGGFLSFPLSVAKLVKKSRLPLVIFNVQGAYHRAPRWANHPFNTSVSIQTVAVLSADTIATMEDSAIYQFIQLYINVRAFEQNHFVHSERRAEHLERALFWCPKCRALHTLKSNNNLLFCTHCDWKVKVNRFLKYEKNSLLDPKYLPHHPYEHDQWQKNWWREQEEKGQLIEGLFTLKKWDRKTRKMRRINKVIVKTDNRFLWIGKEIIPLKDLLEVKINHKQDWECTTSKHRYLFYPEKNQTLGYFWAFIVDLRWRSLYNNPEVLS